MKEIRRLLRYSAFLLVLVPLLSCGRKTEPIPPQAAIPAPIKDLSYRFSGEEVVLEWTYPRYSIDDQKIEKVRRFVLHKSDQAARDYCPGCPDTVTSLKEIEPSSTRPGRSMEFRDSHLVPGHHYSYQVISHRGWNIVSPPSNRVSFWWSTPPAAPEPIEVSQTGRDVEISWEAVKKDNQGEPLDHPVRYQIFRRTASGKKFDLQKESSETTYYDQVNGEEKYHYRVRAVISYRDTAIPGPHSKTAAFTPEDRTPPPVPEIAALITSDSGPRIIWERVSASDLAGYRIYRRPESSREWTMIKETGANTFIFKDESLSSEKGTWYYTITSFDKASPPNESDFSREVSFEGGK
ncbi:MAG: fibronectin type III domain-containing protein [Desulfurivibrionaceae bacterium]